MTDDLMQTRCQSRSKNQEDKEIGIKKVAGADQISMIFQFMGESLILVTMAMVLAVIMVGLFLGIF